MKTQTRPQPYEILWYIGGRLVKIETHSFVAATEQTRRLLRAGLDASLYLGGMEIPVALEPNR